MLRRKSLAFFVILLFIVFSSFFTPLYSFSKENGTKENMDIAVVEFDVRGDLGIEDAGAIIAEWMISAIGRTEKYNLKERIVLKKILEEQQLGLTGVIDEQTTSKIGKVYGVQGLVTGSVIKWGDVISVTVRLIDTETGSILKTADVKTTNVNDIPTHIETLAAVIAGKEPKKQKIEIVSPLQDNMITAILTVSGKIQTDDPWITGDRRVNEWAKPMYRIWFDTNGNPHDGGWDNGQGPRQAEIWLDTGRLGFRWDGPDGKPNTEDDVKHWPLTQITWNTWSDQGIEAFITNNEKSLQVRIPLEKLGNPKTLEVSFMASPWTSSASDNLGSGANSQPAWIVVSNAARSGTYSREDQVGDNEWPSLRPNRQPNFDVVNASIIIQ